MSNEQLSDAVNGSEKINITKEELFAIGGTPENELLTPRDSSKDTKGLPHFVYKGLCEMEILPRKSFTRESFIDHLVHSEELLNDYADIDGALPSFIPPELRAHAEEVTNIFLERGYIKVDKEGIIHNNLTVLG